MNFKARRVFSISSIFPAISLLIFLLFTSHVFAGSHDKIIKIGVRAHSGADAALKKWSPTADYLSHRIKGVGEYWSAGVQWWYWSGGSKRGKRV